MSEGTQPTRPATPQPAAAPPKPRAPEIPSKVYLVPYPKIIFLYPTLLVSLVAAIYLSFAGQPLDETNTAAIVLSATFLIVLGVNLVVLAFDFPRTTSLTLFFLVVALVLGGVLLFVLKPGLLPVVNETLQRFHPLANATFFWAFTIILGLITLAAIADAQLDRWEARPNELLHHHGIWGNLERFPTTGLRVDKELNDVFEYMLLQSGRMILHPSNERRTIVLDNIPFIRKKEAALTRMLGALQVEVLSDNHTPDAL